MARTHPHLARTCRVPHRQPGRQAHLRRPLPDRQSALPEEEQQPERVDLIALTHGHGDHVGDTIELWRRHSCPSSRRSSCRLARRQGGRGGRRARDQQGRQRDLDGLRVTLTNAYHSSSYDRAGTAGTYAGEACGLVLELESGFRLYFAGDTCVFGDMALIARLYEPDMVVLPIGDHYTMDPREAALALELLGAKRCVPGTTAPFPCSPARRSSCASSPRGRDRARRARRVGRAVRERWFGATGRRVPELALEGTLDVEGALVLEERATSRLRDAHGAGHHDDGSGGVLTAAGAGATRRRRRRRRRGRGASSRSSVPSSASSYAAAGRAKPALPHSSFIMPAVGEMTSTSWRQRTQFVGRPLQHREGAGSGRARSGRRRAARAPPPPSIIGSGCSSSSTAMSGDRRAISAMSPSVRRRRRRYLGLAEVEDETARLAGVGDLPSSCSEPQAPRRSWTSAGRGRA